MNVVLWLLLAVPLAGALLLAAGRRLVPDAAVAAVGAVVGGVTLALAVVLAAAFDYGAAHRVQFETDVAWIPAIDVRWHLGLDGISVPMVLLTALLAFLCLLYTTRIAPEAGRTRGLVALVFLLEVGMLGTFVAFDLIVFFLFFEVVLIPMWFVIAGWGDPHDGPGRRRAATTFILYTLLGSAVMLLGFLLVYAGAGTFDLTELAAGGGRGIAHGTQVLAAVAIGLGLAVKSPMWPLHSWLPDAHAKAPTIGSVLLAGVLLKMGTYGFVRVWLPVVPDGARAVAPYLAGLATVGILYGALACLRQGELKRLIAYSSVGHMGFVLLGIATLTPVGVNGALFAGVAHGLITGLLFFLAGAIKDRHGTGDLVRLGGGLYSRMPRLAGLFVFGAVASLGLPGLAGFWGEMLAMFGAFQPAASLGRTTYLVLMVLAGLGTVLTAAYFLVLVRRLCQGADTIGPSLAVARDVTAVEVVAWAPLVLLTLVLGLYPRAVLAITEPAVQVLVGR
ncbi:complex I subunit 4 family protein [Actinopolymorpha pittospori]|uniref:NADH-quinone oxidoreductase subunit M n=1 Tax=Actinopolymorpha pittospori TaxID=648752 RepID=A0A927MU16_9ACTN|nr:NADH-quinone oxidoreductase subunit M [Actinopolymorpha pittospori]MBE1606905.1 NADH-quinone oxidoreductase subunit M [Actinopolymorpha pittospori]